MMPSWRSFVAGAAVVPLAVAVLAGCGREAATGAKTSPGHPAGSGRAPATEEYLPGVAADVFLPKAARRAPVVVLVPGGSWLTADRTGLLPLAADLAAHGMVAVAATYRAADDGVRFPVPVSDIVCAVDFAVGRARQAGIAPGPVLVLGHSSGAHLAALAALATAHFRGDCPYRPAQVDGLIGLAGPYDIMSLQDVAEPLFGVSSADDEAVWREGDPATWVRQRPDLPVLLAHGAEDTTVSSTFTTSFARRLEDAGHPVEVQIVPGADHGGIYQPDVIGDRIIAWIHLLR